MAANSKLEPLFSDELRYTSSIDHVGNLKWVQEGEGTIVNLLNRIRRSQITKDTAFRLFQLSWELQKGMYQNDVKLNFHGDFQYSLFRDKFRVPGNNMFTPAWVDSCLIEATMFGKSPKPSQHQKDLALNAIDKYRNFNKPYKNSEMTFWHQKLNKTANYYQSSPDNLFEVLKLPDYLPQKLIEESLSFMGLDDIEKS
ncbi:hypothetical protein ACF0H5_001890 [Mactra antiquata]